MNSICGVFYKDGRSVDSQQIEDMLFALSHWQPAGRKLWIEGNVGLGQIHLNSTNRKLENLIFEFQHIVVVADARIDNKKELINQIGGDFNDSDSEFIARSYLKWSNNCAEHLIGDFAFAIWDKKLKQLYCARDHIGARSFYYYEDQEKYVFSTEIKAIKVVAGADISVSEKWIADTIAIILSEPELTFYDKILGLKSAHFIEVNVHETKLVQYWDLDFSKETRFSDENEYYEAFRELLKESVKCRILSDMPVAAELSGGLDSSVITAIAFDLLERNNDLFYALSHVLPENNIGKVFPFKDEREYSNLLCNYKGIKNHIYVTSEKKTFLKETEKYTELLGGVSQQRLSLFSDNLYEKASAVGCRTLFSGFGGDQLVTYPGTGYFEELAHGWKFRKLLLELKGRKGAKPYRRLAGFIVKEFAPFVYKLRNPDNQWAIERFEQLLIDKDILEKHNITERYKERVGFPTDKQLKLRQYKRLTHPHVSGRLENCNIVARNYGLQYVYPLLDKRLMELYFSFPSDVKYKNGTGRYVFRQAIKGMVPEEIQWRKDKSGATIPTVQQRFLKDVEKIRQLIIEAENEEQVKYVDYHKTLLYLDKMANRDMENHVSPGVLFNAISVLVYQKMLREGRF